MSVLSNVKEFFRVLGQIKPAMAAKKYDFALPEDKRSFGARFQQSAQIYPDNTMLVFEGREWTYRQFNEEVNQLAHLLKQRGLTRGDVVAVFMENRAEYVKAMLALAKLGVAGSLINNSLTGQGLAHCINSTNTQHIIVGEERAEVLADVLPLLPLEKGADFLWMVDQGLSSAPEWAQDAADFLPAMPTHNLAETDDITAGETAYYIFTSGTTGLPKAAVLPHRKILISGELLGPVGFQVQPQDRLYLCLPIYHITAMGPGFCGFVCSGATVYLRRTFSASKFWPEVKAFQTNCFMYVGELCRYLMNNPVCPEERNNPLQKMMGNGLRPDIWMEFKQRFEVDRICEMYGASEGNVAFVNLLNKNKTIGAATTPVALVKYDVENDEVVRDGEGRCIEVGMNEPGLLLGEINSDARFDGYTDPEATKKKLLDDVLAPGDQWFNTGDLVRQIDVGFALGLKHFQFVDRTGDTFRWRAENVSTNEVAEVVNQHSQITMANVYGVAVPGTEGKAGMVTVSVEQPDEFDLEQFQTLVESQLPGYAQPVFIRLQQALDTTVTFKLQKVELREQAYHLDKVGDDRLFVKQPRSNSYSLLDSDFHQKLVQGSSGY